jgi:carboxylesterase
MIDNPHLHNPHLPGQPFCLEGTGPDAVLLFHGFTATCAEVERLGRVLNQAGFTTMGPLLPGHGTRPEDLNRSTWQEWLEAADRAYASLRARGGRVIVGGESNGGLIALSLAARHPETAAVLAYAPAMRLPLSRVQRLQLRLAAALVPALPKGDLTGNTTWQGYKVNPPKAVLQLIRLQEVVAAQLPKLRAPLLIVQGRKDRTIDPHGAQILYENASSPLKELHWLEDSGHCVLLEAQQDEAARLTLDFLARASAP